MRERPSRAIHESENFIILVTFLEGAFYFFPTPSSSSVSFLVEDIAVKQKLAFLAIGFNL